MASPPPAVSLSLSFALLFKVLFGGAPALAIMNVSELSIIFYVCGAAAEAIWNVEGIQILIFYVGGAAAEAIFFINII